MKILLEGRLSAFVIHRDTEKTQTVDRYGSSFEKTDTNPSAGQESSRISYCFVRWGLVCCDANKFRRVWCGIAANQDLQSSRVLVAKSNEPKESRPLELDQQSVVVS